MNISYNQTYLYNMLMSISKNQYNLTMQECKKSSTNIKFDD
jgi:hypothetical protein